MKLLQAFQMPVHIDVLLGSTQGEMRLGGSQPGNGLRSSALLPAQWKSLGTQGCSAGRAAGCQGNERACFYVYVTLGKGRTSLALCSASEVWVHKLSALLSARPQQAVPSRVAAQVSFPRPKRKQEDLGFKLLI